MTKMLGDGRRYLMVDLSTEKWEVRLFSDREYRDHLGGEAMAIHLWESMVEDPAAVEALGDANPLCIVCGALVGTGTACAGQVSLVAKSPLTSLLGTSTTSAGFAQVLKKAGWDGVVLVGSSRRPMVLRIGPAFVEFRTSERLIGLTSGETAEALKLSETERMLCIGPAGENKIPFASIISDGYVLDRGGLGAVLGSKRIKAIVFQEGDCEILPVDTNLMLAGQKSLEKILAESAFVGQLRDQGTLGVMDQALAAGFAAVDNFSRRTDPRLYHLNGKETTRRFSIELSACEHCTMECKRTIRLPEGEDILPDYEIVSMLGSNLGNYDIQLVIKWYMQCIRYGLDPLSTGNVLAWAMEAQQQGLIDWAGVLAFGVTDSVEQTIESIALRKGIGMQLGKGVRDLSLQYGGSSFACHVHGMEMSAYDPRGAWGTGLLLGAGERFPFIPEVLFTRLVVRTSGSKVAWAAFQEDLVSALRALGCCPHLVVPVLLERFKFSTFSSRWSFWFSWYLPTIFPRLFPPRLFAQLIQGLAGFEMSGQDLLAVGKRTSLMKLELALAMGEGKFPFSLPERFLLDPDTNHPHPVVIPYRRLSLLYRRLRAKDRKLMKEL